MRDRVSRIKSDGPARAMLDVRARELGIDGRSSMLRRELLEAIEKTTEGQGRRKASGNGAGLRDGTGSGLAELSKGELYARAKKPGVEGRSRMSKDELVRAIGG